MQMHDARQPLSTRLGDEQGVALIIAFMTILLMTALGMALVSMTMTETRISANYREGNEALYAADAAVERVMQDVLTVPDWNTILAGDLNSPSGQITSAFIDGPAGGERTLPDGTTLDLTTATHMVRCGNPTCDDSTLFAPGNPDRPWGRNNPVWRLYAYGPLEEMTPTRSINSRMYVVVWIADDPSENDNNPMQDGTLITNPGRGVLSMLAHAYGPQGVQRVVEVTIARTDTTEIERGYTGQRGQDEQNRRARKAAVQTPGQALTRTDMTLSTGGMVTR